MKYYEWLKVPAAWEWGIDDLVIVQAQTCRLILCRVENSTAFGIRKWPITVGELEEAEVGTREVEKAHGIDSL